MIALFVDSKTKTIETIDMTDTNQKIGIEAALNGEYETACILENQDMVLVGEDGLIRFEDFFCLNDGTDEQPYGGCGLIVGPKNDAGEFTDCLISVEEIENQIQFLNRAQVIGWLNDRRHYDRTNGFARFI